MFLCFHLHFFRLYPIQFFHSVVNSSAHHTHLQLIRIFIIDNTAFICHPVTLIFHIGQQPLCCLRIHAFHILKITLFYSLATVELSVQMLLILLVGLVMNSTAFGLGFLFKRLFRIDNRYFPYLLAGYEVGLLGMALFRAEIRSLPDRSKAGCLPSRSILASHRLEIVPTSFQ